MEYQYKDSRGNVTRFAIGSVVRVKGQPVSMTITEIEKEIARTVWFVESFLHSGTFPLGSLDLVK